ncbi:MAG: cytochrome P450 [Tissierellales bacterium]
MTEMTEKPLKEFSMADDAVAACPFKYYERMRHENPVHLDPGLNFYWVAKRDDVIAGTRDWEHFTSEHDLQQRSNFYPKGQKIFEESGIEMIGTLVNSDPPRHDDYRSVAMGVFTPKRVAEISEHIESIINELIDDFIQETEIDFVSRFAQLLPATVVCDEYGFPREDRAIFKYWTDGVILLQTPGITEDEEAELVHRIVDSYKYLEKYIIAAANDPSGRVLHTIATMNRKDGTPFTMMERISMAIAVFVGGNETTVNMLASGVYRLATMPELQQTLRDDPSLIPNFVEELLRMDGSVQALVRVAKEGAELGGKSIEAGTPVILCTGSANRDEEYWPDPDEFKLDRPRPQTHLTFGYGKHVCIGAHLARVELRLAFRILLERLDNIRLQNPDGPSPYLPLPYYHAIAQLPIAFDPKQ